MTTAVSPQAGEEPEDKYLAEPGISGLFTRLTRVGLLLDAFQHRCFDRFGLRFIDYSVLRILLLNDRPYQMSPTELAELVLRSSGGMTQILDRLAASGLVERANDPADRRRILVGLTPKGVRVARESNAFYAAERNRLFGVLSEAEVARIDTAVRRLLDLLSSET